MSKRKKTGRKFQLQIEWWNRNLGLARRELARMQRERLDAIEYKADIVAEERRKGYVSRDGLRLTER